MDQTTTTEGTVAPVAPEAKPSEPKEPKAVGMEKMVVRIFREVFGRAVFKAGMLQPTLDEFLKLVLNNPEAKKTDKDYARKAYKDMIVWAGGSGLPTWVKDEKDGRVSQAEIDAMLAGIDSPTPPVFENTPVQEGGFDQDEFAEFLSQATPKEDPLRAEDSPFRAVLKDFIENKLKHPPVRSFTFQGQRYVALGTMFGTMASGPHAGKKMNVNCTINPYQTISKVPADVVVYDGSRPMSIMDENERGTRKYVYCCRHKPGRKIRYWVRLADEDQPNGAKFIILTDDEQGWKEVSRNEF